MLARSISLGLLILCMARTGNAQELHGGFETLPGGLGGSECDGGACDGGACDGGACEHCDRLGDQLMEILAPDRRRSGRASRTPAMIGDFFAGSRARFSGPLVIDRLLVIADDLDAPLLLPGAGSTLTITEPGPVGIFDSSVNSIQEVQALLRNGTPLPPAVLAGIIADDATLTTSMTVGQIQALLASTPEAYDIISLMAPPGSYDAAVAAAFAGRNSIAGTTVLNANGSGAVLQGGVDTLNGGEDFDAYYSYQYRAALNLLVPQVSGGGVGRLKIAEGGTVLPQDRVYFRYSYIDDVAYRTNGTGLSRFTPGFERAFHDGLFSFELRAPFASSTVHDLTTDGAQSFGSKESEFGNLTMYLKALLYESNQCVVSGGLGLEVPTASDMRLSFAGTPLLEVANEDVHFQPFLGMMQYWSDNLYCQGFLQFDIAAGRNDVHLNATGNGLSRVGSYSDRDHVFIDYGIGYWLFRNDRDRGLTGIIPTVELHHTNSISGADSVGADGQVFSTSGSTSLTNLVAGTTFEFGRNKQVSVAYTGGLDDDDLSDGALRLMLSHQR